MPLDIVVLGPPGAGKGTQAKLIEADRGIPQIATGDILRAAVAAGSELGLRVKAILDRGDLVPDELMIELIRGKLSEDGTKEGFVLDGFPRTLAQAEALDAMLAEFGRRLALALEFHVPEEVAVERLRGRARAEGRTDDEPEVIRHRLEVFRAQTGPVLEHYRAQGILVAVHAQRPVEEVQAEVQQALDSAESR
uniref:Adenylate kinase n=1 Tax=uncultured actinobacterium Rifle_16ft_4_minimus_15811 TaxID=1665145 RepID=A0A0H4TL90_9ACTN|nr:adenylate kinase, adenylate kinase [uncultured actinobacterium Rifle_16ft_4_minimus_15811]